MLASLLSAAALLGLVAAVVRPVDALALGILAAASGLAAALAWRLPVARLVGLLGVACALGALRPSLWPAPTWDDLVVLHGSRVAVEGRVSAPPRVRGPLVVLRMDVEHAAGLDNGAPGRPVEARIEATAPAAGPAGRLGLGDVVRLEGRLTAPTSPAGFPRADLLRRERVFSTLAATRVERLAHGAALPGNPVAFAAATRHALADGFGRHLPPTEAALAGGLLIGGAIGLDPDLRQRVQAAGLGHLVAVSGYNVALVAGLLTALAVHTVGRQRALVPVLLGLAAYTLLAGATPSAVRAALMGGSVAVAGAVGRIADPLTSLLLAALAMALAHPPVVLDVGFQLSASATLGILLLYPALRPNLTWLPRWAGDALGVTLAAQVATLPIVLAVFQHVSIVAPLANLLAAPLVPAIMAGAALLALALPVPPLAQVVAGLAWLPSALLAALADTTGALPFAAVWTGDVPLPFAFGLAATLLMAGSLLLPDARSARTWLTAHLAAIPRGWRLAIAVLACGLALSGAALAGRSDDRLRVSVLEAGRGRAFLVRGPSGATVLVVGAEGDPRGLASLVGERLSAWEWRLDAAVLLDPDDPMAATETLRRYPAALRLDAVTDARLDLGGGAVLDVLVDGQPLPAVVLRHGETWLRLAGTAEPSADDADAPPLVGLLGGADWSARQAPPWLALRGLAGASSAVYAVDGPDEGVLDVLGDGTLLWTEAR